MLALRCSDLPVPLLSRLVSLERLDLSGNQLKDLPRTLALPKLKQLDLSDNNMEDVTSLEGLDAVEELCMEDNVYITVSDNYKMMVLLPQLRMYNGKDVTATANHVRYVYTDNLRSRIVSLWERNFSLPQPLNKDKMAALETNFVNMAKQQVKFGPSSVSDFTKWRVGIMAAEFLKSLTQPKKQPQKTLSTEEPENTTPLKRKRAASPAKTQLTPVKGARESPRKPGLRLTPQKQNQSSSPRKTGLKLTPQKENQASSPRKTSLRPIPSTNHTSSPRETSTPSRDPPGERPMRQTKQNHVSLKTSRGPAENLLKNQANQKPVVLKTHHVLQCHSKQDSPDDLSTQLWACAFPPSTTGCSRLVATCGGDSVCLIDCEVGVVMKKYKVPGEEFFTLSWSTVLMCCGKSTAAVPCSVLAAGGKRGVVKLIHPRNNIAYGEFRASRKALSVLRFNPNKGNFLYTGSYDNKIVLWDIGGLDNQYNYKVVQLMSLDCSSTPLHLSVPPKAPLSHILSACDNGLHCFSNPNPITPTSRWTQMEVTFPVYKEEDSENDYHTVDGLAFLSDDIVASKNFPHGCIYLWSWSQTVAQCPGKKSGAVSAVVLAELQWANSQVPYLGLNTCPGRCYLVCGDDKGQLWTYHLSSLKDQDIQPKILSWPSPQRTGHAPLPGPSINAVTTDPELQYLVALTDKNMVLVWKVEETA